MADASALIGLKTNIQRGGLVWFRMPAPSGNHNRAKQHKGNHQVGNGSGTPAAAKQGRGKYPDDPEHDGDNHQDDQRFHHLTHADTPKDKDQAGEWDSGEKQQKDVTHGRLPACPTGCCPVKAALPRSIS